MNQYEDAAVQQALADIQRAGNIQQQQGWRTSGWCGCLWRITSGGSRTRITKKHLEQQGRTAAGMRQARFESASQRAQQAF